MLLFLALLFLKASYENFIEPLRQEERVLCTTHALESADILGVFPENFIHSVGSPYYETLLVKFNDSGSKKYLKAAINVISDVYVKTQENRFIVNMQAPTEVHTQKQKILFLVSELPKDEVFSSGVSNYNGASLKLHHDFFAALDEYVNRFLSASRPGNGR